MDLRKIILPLFCAGALASSAVPAKLGVVHTFTQPDGTQINLSLVGDEHSHYYLTDDNKVVLAKGSSFYYASIDSKGDITGSDMLAHNLNLRSSDECAVVNSINQESVLNAYRSLSKKSPLRANASENTNGVDGVGLIFDHKFPLNGQVKALVFLVEYQDVEFQTENASEYFHNMINQEGFSEQRGTGCAREYYRDNSNGIFEPMFDVYGPVKLPQNRSYYGGNGSSGSDSKPHYMMLHAAQALDEEVDFSQYDTDGDGYVDNVFIFYAGESEAAGGGSDCVWPHSWQYSFNAKFDGVKFSRYACSSEMITSTMVDGIGTFCHEFNHVLGLPDLYNTNDASVNYTPASWSIMDQGCYNNDSRTPPNLCAYERNALGWMGGNLVEITGPASCTLQPLQDSNMAYLVRTDRDKEFFIFENRSQEGWDKYLPYHGMLVWHIDYNSNLWTNNTVNNTSSHQYVDIVEACNKTYSSVLNHRRYPFPGLLKVTEFKYGGAPSFQPWSGIDLGLDVTNITETNNVITFDVAGGGNDPASIVDVKVGSLSYSVSGKSISVDAEGAISVCDMMGRAVAKGSKSLSTSSLAPGMYIISADNTTVKVIVK